LKYDREILQDDSLIQAQPKPENKTARKFTALGKEMVDCLKEENCPCPKELAKKAKNGTAFLQNATCAIQPKGAASCAQGCSKKVIDRAHVKLEAKKNTKNLKKQVFLQKDYPIHSVTVGVFSRGAMNMDQCLKFCRSHLRLR